MGCSKHVKNLRRLRARKRKKKVYAKGKTKSTSIFQNYFSTSKFFYSWTQSLNFSTAKSFYSLTIFLSQNLSYKHLIS